MAKALSNLATFLQKFFRAREENVNAAEVSKAYKILRDGQVLIIRGEKTYTVTGMEVR